MASSKQRNRIAADLDGLSREAMKIGIIDIDSKIPNLALAKIEMYHKERGDEIFYNLPLMAHQMDKLYVSCIFTWNKHKAKNYEQYKQAEIGGTGYDIGKVLPDDMEILKPKINYGFTTRGCIRHCEFCFVPKKEGRIRAICDIYDIWDGESKFIVLMDNNILALPRHFAKICRQVKKEKLKVDFNQGIDIRLMTMAKAELLRQIRPIRQWRIAFDNMAYEKEFRQGVEIMLDAGIRPRDICVYVLVGFDEPFESDLKRVSIIWDEYKLDPFVMIYRGQNAKEKQSPDIQKLKTIFNVPIWKKHGAKLNKFRLWVNRKAIFKSVKWEDYKK